MPYPHICDVDMASVKFGPFTNTDGKQRVELLKDNKKLVFNLCSEATEPFNCKFRLDSVRDDQDGSRRGLVVAISDQAVLDSLTALDDLVKYEAMQNSKEWFKKANMTKEEVDMRYQPLVFKAMPDDDFMSIKFKVKCKNYPTKLHLLRDDLAIKEDGANLAHISEDGAMVAPILSAFGLWFMGGSRFGITIQAEEMVVKPGVGRARLSNFISKRPIAIHNEDEDEENGDEEDVAVKRIKPSVVELEDDHETPYGV